MRLEFQGLQKAKAAGGARADRCLRASCMSRLPAATLDRGIETSPPMLAGGMQPVEGLRRGARRGGAVARI